MKAEVDSNAKLLAWIQDPSPAVFQGQDLRPHAEAISTLDLSGCVFLGCQLDDSQKQAAARANCLIVPARADLPFDPFTPGLYTPDELFDQFAPEDLSSYERCRDRKIYVSVVNPDTREELPVDVDVALMRRIHDFSITEAHQGHPVPHSPVLRASVRLRRNKRWR